MGGRRRSQAAFRLGRGLALVLLVGTGLVLGAGGSQTEQEPATRLVAEVRAARDAQLLGDWEAVAEHGEAGLRAASKLDAASFRAYVQLIALAENFIASADNARGRHFDAVRRLERVLSETPGLDLARRSFLSSELGEALLELGLPGRAKGPIEDALDCIELDLASGNVDYGALFNAHFLQADLRMALNQYREAAEGLARFEEEFEWAPFEERFPERAGGNRGRLGVRRGAAWLELVEEEPQAAALARAEFESVLASGTAFALERFVAGARLAYLDLQGGEFDAARVRLASLRAEWDASEQRLDTKERAWLAALEARLAVLSEAPSEEAEARLAGEVGALVDEWRGQERPAGFGALRYRRTRFIVSQLLAMGPVERALERLIELQSFGVLWRALDAGTPDLTQVRRTLTGERTGCVVFVAGQDAPLVFAFDRERAVRERLPDHRWIETECNALGGWLGLDPADLSEGLVRLRRLQIDERGERLARGLFPAGVRALLEDWDEVRILGRPVLSGLPVEALPVLDGEPLGCSHAVTDLPSLTVGVALAERRGARAGPEQLSLLLMTAPDVPEELRQRLELEPLEVSDQLVARLRRAFPGPLEVLRGQQAQASALASEKRSAVLQILSHGTPVTGAELHQRIVCSPDPSHPDGLLTIEQVRELEAPDLVLLSVCRAGAGAERLGDAGATDFGGAFLMAGASTVVLSAQDLRLSTAVELSEALYGELGQGVSVAEALRRARVRLRATPAFADPFHWAQTYACGLGGPLSSR